MMREFILTPCQKFEVLFHLELDFSCWKKTEVALQLDDIFKYARMKRTLLGRAPYSTTLRPANFLFTVRQDILEKKKRLNIKSLGSYTILADGKKISNQKLAPVSIIDNNTYFEKETVPEILEELGFIVVSIGGKNEPDIVAYHPKINPQKIDVEPTLAVKYHLEDLDNDRGKFQRYTRQYDFKRLLAVCECNRLSSDVVNELEKTTDPVSLIEYRDLCELRMLTKTSHDQLITYTTLTSTGMIPAQGAPKKTPAIFRPIRFNVKRRI